LRTSLYAALNHLCISWIKSNADDENEPRVLDDVSWEMYGWDTNIWLFPWCGKYYRARCLKIAIKTAVMTSVPKCDQYSCVAKALTLTDIAKGNKPLALLWRGCWVPSNVFVFIITIVIIIKIIIGFVKVWQMIVVVSEFLSINPTPEEVTDAPPPKRRNKVSIVFLQ